MALRSFSSKLFASAMLAASALLLASCGGGGAATPTNPAPGTPLAILPLAANFYAGIPYTISVSGGRGPYTVSSSEQTLLPVPSSVSSNSSFQVLPNNPGVIDVGLDPNAVPSRSVTVTVRDQDGVTLNATYSVLQNFLTGYGIRFVSTCTGGTAGVAPQACAGGETTIFATPVTNGLLYGNRLVRFEIVRGDYQFVQNNGTLGNSFTTNTDHTGTAIARLRVINGAAGQLAVLRIIDVATGVYADEVFVVNPAPTPVLTVIPPVTTFIGRNDATCGTGIADILVFGGTPPYTAVSTNGAVSVTPTVSNVNPGRFTLTAGNQAACGTFSVVITDVTGTPVTATVTTTRGTQSTAVTATPNAVAVGCGQSASASVLGGNGAALSVNSSSPNVTAVLSGNTLTVTRLLQANNPSLTTVTTAVTITDGATTATVNVTNPTTCT